MRLSLKLLHAELNCKYPGTEYRQASADVPQLTSSSILSPSLAPVDEVVYVHVPFLSIPDELGNASVITLSKHAELFPRSNLILLPDDINLLDIPAFIASVFSRYYSWSDSLYEAITRNCDLQTIIDLTVPMVNEPMYFADSSWKMVAYYSGDMEVVNPTWSYQIKYDYLPYQVYQEIIDAGDMPMYRSATEPVYCLRPAGFSSFPFISKAILKEGKHYGNFFIIEMGRKLDARDFEIAEHVGNLVATALYGDNDYLETSALYSSHFIIDVIEGELSSTSLMTEQLRALGWDYEGDYCLSLIDMQDEDAAIVNHVMFLANSISEEASSFVYHGGVVSIYNNYSAQKQRISSHLAGIARDFNRMVALSNPYIRFGNTMQAYKQVSYLCEAARTGSGPSKLLTFTGQYVQFLVDCTQDVAAVGDQLGLLAAHDQEHGSEYCRTLYCWLLCERNSVRAADLLYIHRNTLKNRLVSIEKILGMNFEDPSVRLQLLVGLHELCHSEDLIEAIRKGSEVA